MRVQVDTGIEQRLRQAANVAGAVLTRQVVCEVLCVVFGDHGPVVDERMAYARICCRDLLDKGKGCITRLFSLASSIFRKADELTRAFDRS